MPPDLYAPSTSVFSLLNGDNGLATAFGERQKKCAVVITGVLHKERSGLELSGIASATHTYLLLGFPIEISQGSALVPFSDHHQPTQEPRPFLANSRELFHTIARTHARARAI
jgi:hypothetical protein